jgi:hypothetical protein
MTDGTFESEIAGRLYKASETFSPEKRRKLYWGPKELSLREMAREIDLGTPVGRQLVTMYKEGGEKLLDLGLVKTLKGETPEEATRRVVLDQLNEMVRLSQ